MTNLFAFLDKLHPVALVAKKAVGDIFQKLKNPDPEVFRNYVGAFLVPLMEQADVHDVPMPNMTFKTRFGETANLTFDRSAATGRDIALPVQGDVWRRGVDDAREITHVDHEARRVTYVTVRANGKKTEPATDTPRQWEAWSAGAKKEPQPPKPDPVKPDESAGDSGKADQG